MASTPDVAPAAAAAIVPAPRRRSRRRVGHFLKQLLLRAALRVIPTIYMALMWFVWATSEVEDGVKEVHDIRRRHDGVVCLLWHEEVFTVAYAYRDFHPHTLASYGDSGEAISRALDRCGFTVFRGGSTKRRASWKHRDDTLRDLIDHMKSTREVLYGLTVDGSMGPRYVLKKGGLVIARECRKPVVLVKTWYKRAIRLPSWDRTGVPLPFNTIVRAYRGPFFVPDDADTPEKLEPFRRMIERELAELNIDVYRRLGVEVPPELGRAAGAGEATPAVDTSTLARA
jgi:lysophospholipid acyltransferase (LPLAT)-like uncharacterized protein